MKGVQCYELFGGMALKNHAFSFSFFVYPVLQMQNSSQIILINIFKGFVITILLRDSEYRVQFKTVYILSYGFLAMMPSRHSKYGVHLNSTYIHFNHVYLLSLLFNRLNVVAWEQILRMQMRLINV